jgi:hypothetical protein
MKKITALLLGMALIGQASPLHAAYGSGSRSGGGLPDRYRERVEVEEIPKPEIPPEPRVTPPPEDPDRRPANPSWWERFADRLREARRNPDRSFDNDGDEKTPEDEGPAGDGDEPGTGDEDGSGEDGTGEDGDGTGPDDGEGGPELGRGRRDRDPPVRRIRPPRRRARADDPPPPPVGPAGRVPPAGNPGGASADSEATDSDDDSDTDWGRLAMGAGASALGIGLIAFGMAGPIGLAVGAVFGAGIMLLSALLN